MVHRLYCLLLLLFIAFNSDAKLPIERIIIWGHPLHSHTHSYIHWGFYRAFKHLGYETHWVKSLNEIKNISLKNSLFLTAGTCDQNIPIRNDCWYILHNCNSKKYQPILSQDRAIIMQVYTHDCLTRNLENMEPYIYREPAKKRLYMPWATDLLPHEIDENKLKVKQQKDSIVYWVGTIWSSEFGNAPEINAFKKACAKSDIKFKVKKHVSMQKNEDLIQKSYIAPAIQGQWQCKHGYIPCRIFKNISYGHMGVTNSRTVYDLFKEKIVYNQNCYQLFYDAQNKIHNMTTQELWHLMDFVRDNHTYLNRIEQLLSFLSDVSNREK